MNNVSRHEASPIRQTHNVRKKCAARQNASMGSPVHGCHEDDSPKRSIGRRLIPGEATSSESSMVNFRHSTSPSLATKRPCSVGAASTKRTPEPVLSPNAALKEKMREGSIASRGCRRPGSRRRRSDNTLGRSIAANAVDSGSKIASFGDVAASSQNRGGRIHRRARSEFQGIRNNSGTPITIGSNPIGEKRRPSPKLSHEAPESSSYKQKYRNSEPAESVEKTTAVASGTESPGIFLQPETHPLTEEQIVNEVRGIYAGLVMVEKKCIEIDAQQRNAENALSHMQWQALIALHRTYMHEHHDFFLASQHPAAVHILLSLNGKYFMPARLWRHGIHSFLELLRHHLPNALEHMLSFIYLSYSMMTLLLESVPMFEDAWIECLGDLARYRMAVEEVDLRDREIWSGVARYWYIKSQDRNPDVGRIQHHLAVLARPDTNQQLFYYTKALTSPHPFADTVESISLLFEPYLQSRFISHHQHQAITALISAHAYLYNYGPTDGFFASANEFLSNLEKFIGRMGAAFKTQGIFLLGSNFAIMFEYNSQGALLPEKFNHQQIQPPGEAYKNASSWASTGDTETVKSDFLTCKESGSISQLIFYGPCLAFQTLSIILDEIGNKNVYPSLHFSLAFIWCFALSGAIKHIEPVVPWGKLAIFFNTMIRDEMDTRIIEGQEFPTAEEGQQMPEDFFIRGHVWSRNYYPPHFFDKCLPEEEGRLKEVPSLNVSRLYRCLWLGVRIAGFNRWLAYDSSSKRFAITPFAEELEGFSKQFNPFNQKAEMNDPASSDLEMQDT